jgi:hypothetical protein
MKDLIRRILRESWESLNPEWFKKFMKMNREERIQFIDNKRNYIEKILPKLEKFLRLKYKRTLDYITISKLNVKYADEDYITEQFYIKLYFSNIETDYSSLKKSIFRDLSMVFGLDVEYYGIPMNIQFYENENKKSDEFNPRNYRAF